jgi:basic amino acid/polyamine antiporter, APA family
VTSTDRSSQPRVRRVIGRGGYFALSFGTIIGSAWLAVLGNWLSSAGPGGALVGFTLGACVVLLIAFCYAELAARLPHAGGEFLYALRGFGPRAAFAVGWFLTLNAVAVGAFEGIVLAMFLTRLVPPLTGPLLYRVLDHNIFAGALVMGLGTAVLLAMLNTRDLRLSIGFQRVTTYSFLAIVIGLLAAGFWHGTAANLQPWFASATDRPWWVGTLWIFASCALFLNGFEVALYTLEERKEGVSVHAVVVTMIWGLLAAVGFYCLTVLSAGSLAPWRKLVASELPAVAAYSLLGPPRLMEAIILGAACLSLLKTWNALVIFGSQLLVAQASEGMIPAALSDRHSRNGTPVNAIVFMTAAAMALILLGRGAVLPIVNMVSICLAVTFVISLITLLKLRRRASSDRDRELAFTVPGGNVVIWIALLGALVMAAVALIEPSVRDGGIPIEWLLLAAWGLIGAVFWKSCRRTRSTRSACRAGD